MTWIGNSRPPRAPARQRFWISTQTGVYPAKKWRPTRLLTMMCKPTLSNTVWLQADVTDNDEADQALLSRFGVFGPPTIIFFGADGQQRHGYEVVGYMKADDFVEHLATRRWVKLHVHERKSPTTDKRKQAVSTSHVDLRDRRWSHC